MMEVFLDGPALLKLKDLAKLVDHTPEVLESKDL